MRNRRIVQRTCFTSQSCLNILDRLTPRMNTRTIYYISLLQAVYLVGLYADYAPTKDHVRDGRVNLFLCKLDWAFFYIARLPHWRTGNKNGCTSVYMVLYTHNHSRPTLTYWVTNCHRVLNINPMERYSDSYYIFATTSSRGQSLSVELRTTVHALHGVVKYYTLASTL